MVRLDFFLVSQSSQENMVRADIIPPFMSDHLIPAITYQKQTSKRGPGFWHLNNSLLMDKEYCQQINELITDLKKEKYDTISKKWHFIKMKVRGHSIQYTARKKKSEVNLLKAIERKLTKSYQDLEQGDSIFTLDDTKKHIMQLEQDREELIQKKLEGSKVKLRREWLEHGEKNSKMFFNLEAKAYKKKNRYHLLDENGEIHSKNQDILKIQKNYY